MARPAIAITLMGVALCGAAGHARAQSVSVPVVRSGPRVVTADGQPVRGAVVTFLDSDEHAHERVVTTATTGADGSFRVPPRPDADDAPPDRRTAWTIMVEAPGHGLSGDYVDGSTSREVRLNPATELRVKLLRPDGKPAAGLRVAPRILSSRDRADPSPSWALVLPDEVQERLAQKSDAEGVVVLPALPRGARLQLAVLDGQEFARLNYDNAVSLGKEPLTRADPIRLKPGAAVAGRVVYGETGKPVKGALVRVQGVHSPTMTTGWGEALSTADGAYRIPCLTPGTYNVCVDLPDDLAKDWAVAAVEKVAVAEGAEVKGQGLKLVRGGVIVGKLVASDTKVGFAGLSVGFHGPARPRSSSGIQNTRTGPDGSFTFRVPPGKQYVYFQDLVPDGYLRPKVEGQEPEVAEGGSAQVTLELPRDPSPPLEGRVLAPDGRPAAGAWVWAEPQERGMLDTRHVKAGEGGRFRFVAVPPKSRLHARLGEMETTEAVEVKGGEENLTLQLRDNAKASLLVTVKDEEGKPVPGAKVQLTLWTGDMGLGSADANWVTDKEGQYLLENLSPDRKYSLWIEADGFGVGQGKVNALKAGQKNLADPVVLTRADRFIKGRVVDQAGDPLPGIMVEINSSQTGHKTTKTDDKGRFRFRVVRGARPLIYMRNEEGQSVGVRDAKEGNEDLELVSIRRRC